VREERVHPEAKNRLGRSGYPLETRRSNIRHGIREVNRRIGVDRGALIRW
jgi:hypothetical protein